MKEPDPLNEEEVGKFGKKNYEEYPVPPCVCVRACMRAAAAAAAAGCVWLWLCASVFVP